MCDREFSNLSDNKQKNRLQTRQDTWVPFILLVYTLHTGEKNIQQSVIHEFLLILSPFMIRNPWAWLLVYGLGGITVIMEKSEAHPSNKYITGLKMY